MNKGKGNQRGNFPDVKTPAPPQEINPLRPAQENADNEKKQRPGKHKPDSEKAKLLGDPVDIEDETII